MRITLPAPDEAVVIDSVSPEEFEAILDELGESPARRIAYDGVAYENGRLEIMSPSRTHEEVAEFLALFLRTLCEEFGLEFSSCGSWTLRRGGLNRAVEADHTFYVGDEARIRSIAGRDLDLTCDPPPDVVIEVDVTRKSLPRFPIYADIGVPEIWRWESDGLEVWKLGDAGRAGAPAGEREYKRADASRFFPAFPMPELAGFVERGLSGEVGEVRLAQEFREWVRENRGRAE